MFRGKWIGSLLLAASVCFLFASLASAQNFSGSITGRLVDPQGSGIPGAKVTVIDVDKGVSTTVRTDATGEFTFPVLDPGTYNLEAAAQGFQVFDKQGLVLHASSTLSAGSLTMKVGTVNQSVTVTASNVQVETNSSSRGALLDSNQIGHLMTVGRGIMPLLQTLPGVVLDGHGGSRLGSESSPNINGQRSMTNHIVVDGNTASVRGGDHLDTPVNLDAIQEVQVRDANYSAKYGETSGATIQIVTKSGTKAFHGSLYYYGRNTALNANSFFNNAQGRPRDTYRFNTVGFDVGGPVMIPHLFNRGRKKLFFFYSQEIDPNVTPEGPYHFRMPTAKERVGDFTEGLSPAPLDPTTGKPYDAGCPLILPGSPDYTAANACSMTAANAYDPNMATLLNIFPLPNASLGSLADCKSCNWELSSSDKIPSDQELLKIDYVPTDKWRIAWRGTLTHVKTDGLHTPAGFPEWLGNMVPMTYSTPSPSTMVTVTTIFKPTLINQVYVGAGWWKEFQILDRPSDYAQITKSGIGMTFNQLYPENNPLGLIPMPSSFGLSSNATVKFDGRFPMQDDVHAKSLTDDLTWVRSTHTLSFGGVLEHDTYIQLHNRSNFSGKLDFSPSSSYLNTNNGYANALVGLYRSYSEPARRPDYTPTVRVLEWYAQDDWRVVPRLTLNYGVRFTYGLAALISQAGNFYPGLYDPAQAPLLYLPSKCKVPGSKQSRNATDPTGPAGNCMPAAYIGAIIPGTGNVLNGAAIQGQSGFPDGLVGGQGFLWAPRFGFAWDVFGNGKTALRGGFGRFYNSLLDAGAEVGNLTFNPPNINDTNLGFGNVTDISSFGGAGILSPGSFGHAVETHPPLGENYNVTLGIQQDIGHGVLLDVAYVGAFGRHLDAQPNINEVLPGSRFVAANQDPTTSQNLKSCSGLPSNLNCNFYASLPAGYHPLSDNFFRPYPGWGTIAFESHGLTSNYNSLQVQVQRRFKAGLGFGLSYTYSKTMDYSDEYNKLTESGSGGWNVIPTYPGLDAPGASDPLRAVAYGLAGYDRTHIMRFNWVWDVPSLAHYWNNFVSRAIFSGWEWSGITTFENGPPYGIDMTFTGAATDVLGGGDSPRVVLTGNPMPSGWHSTPDEYFDTSVFTAPALGQYGNAGKTVFRGPGINNWDMKVSRYFHLTERSSFQVAGEFYNAFNHTNFTLSDSSGGNAKFSWQQPKDANGNTVATAPFQWVQVNSDFGRLTGARSPRIIQVELRLTF